MVTPSIRRYLYTDKNAQSASASTELDITSSSPSLKRKPEPAEANEGASPIVSAPNKKPKQRASSSSVAPASRYAHVTNRLTDSLAPNLICVFIGVNPGIRTATAGHAYAHPSNLFWRLAYRSGCTPRLCRPDEDGDLPRLYALGNTNIVRRPTKDASELSSAEMDAGVATLEEKCRSFRPESVCLVGKSIWETVWRVRHGGRKITKAQFKYGWQDERENMGVVKAKQGEEGWKGARLFVATTTSGLAAGMSLHEKEEIWRGLGEFVERRRKEMGITDEGGVPEQSP